MRFLTSSYDNDLLDSTDENGVPCQYFEVALFTRKKKKSNGKKRKAPNFSAKKITTIQKQMFCSNTFVMGSC